MRASPERRGAAIARCARGIRWSIVCLFAAACASLTPRIEPPQVSLESVRVVRIVGGKAEVSVVLKLFNPNAMSIAVKALDYEVTLDGRPAASGRTVRADSLPAGGEARVELAGRVDVAAVATAMMALGSQLPVAYALKGTVTAEDWGPIAFSRKGEIAISRFDPASGSRPR